MILYQNNFACYDCKNYSDRSKEAREHFYGHSSGVNECIVKCHNTYSPSNENLTNDVQDDEE